MEFLQHCFKIYKSSGPLRWYATAAEAKFDLKPFKLHKLEAGPNSTTTVTKDEALNMYYKMQTIRRMETNVGKLYREKIIRGFCHLYMGEEAIAVGMKAAMRPTDHLITSFRCHGWTYMMGVPVVNILAELAGRVGGAVHGKGGSMHMYAKNYYGGNGIVGAQQSLGAGVAFAIKYKGEKDACYTLYGDGAANQGQLFEATNMAKLWNLPCVFVCENNGYGMGTSSVRSSASTEYYTRGDYVPGIWVDAMDVLTVREATRFASEYCSAGHGPLVIEMATYRYAGHSMVDPDTSYRTRDEIADVRKKRDSISHFKDNIVSANLVTEDELKEVEKRVIKEVEDAVQAALQQPEPPLEELYSDVFCDTPDTLIRGCTPKQWIRPIPTTAEVLENAESANKNSVYL